MDTVPTSATGVTDVTAERSGIASLTAFPDSGYYVLAQRDGRLIADFGGPGESPNPGHQHAGIFSYEVSLEGRRVVVDSGTASYETGSERQHARGTSAHNTVCVDGEDQYEVWKAFRVGRRAHVGGVLHESGDDFAWISGAHNGYKPLGVEHRRAIAVLGGAGWVVIDWLRGNGPHQFESFVHLHPEIEVGPSEREIRLTPTNYSVIDLTGGRFEIRDDWYSPRLGQRIPSRTLVQTGEVLLAPGGRRVLWTYGLLANPVESGCVAHEHQGLIEITTVDTKWNIAAETAGLLRITRNRE